MTARDDTANVLWESIDGKGIKGRLYREDCDYLADALLASPVFARLIREAKAEGWDEGWGSAADEMHPGGPHSARSTNPYRTDDTEEHR